MEGRALQVNGVHVKRVRDVSKFPLLGLLRLEGRTCRMLGCISLCSILLRSGQVLQALDIFKSQKYVRS